MIITVGANRYRIKLYTVQPWPHTEPRDLDEMLAVYPEHPPGLPVATWHRPSGSQATWEHPPSELDARGYHHWVGDWPEMAAVVARACGGAVRHGGVVYGGQP